MPKRMARIARTTIVSTRENPGWPRVAWPCESLALIPARTSKVQAARDTSEASLSGLFRSKWPDLNQRAQEARRETSRQLPARAVRIHVRPPDERRTYLRLSASWDALATDFSAVPAAPAPPAPGRPQCIRRPTLETDTWLRRHLPPT